MKRRMHALASRLALLSFFAAACSSSEAPTRAGSSGAGGSNNAGKNGGAGSRSVSDAAFGSGGSAEAGGGTGSGGFVDSGDGSDSGGRGGAAGGPGSDASCGSCSGQPCSPSAPCGWVDRCPAYPSFPDANCTGPTSSTLPLYTGSLDFRTNNQVIENVEMRIDRGLYVPADNVTFRNVKIVFTGALNSDFTAVNLNYNTGTIFQDCEIDGRGNVARAITGSAVTVRNCELHHVGNGIETEGPLVVEGNYIHDIYEPSGTDWHADGIQTPISTGNITIRHNTVFGRDPSTSAINMMGTMSSPATNVLIEHNLLAGGGYTVYAGPGSKYCVINNHFSTQFFPKVGFFNIWYWDPSQDGDVTRCGNVIHETGADANDNL